jgi:hypothetical protein
MLVEQKSLRTDQVEPLHRTGVILPSVEFDKWRTAYTLRVARMEVFPQLVTLEMRRYFGKTKHNQATVLTRRKQDWVGREDACVECYRAASRQ